MNEQETRTNLILPKIQEAGWGATDTLSVRGKPQVALAVAKWEAVALRHDQHLSLP